ncbi:hypothetical protein [Paracoccus sp. KR1-242]|uniref:hypothetical protein n=1 Tax=Paracoccus sp. KR1-242 TaxID=3410028 RepID=UPI003C0AEB06
MDPLNPFAPLDDAMAAACEQAFGIAVRIEPWADVGGYGDGGPDPDRPPRAVVGILSSAPRIEGAGGQGRNEFGGPGKVSGQTVVVGLSAATIRSLPYELHPGDRIVLPNVQPPYPTTFVISRLLPTDLGELELFLNEA